MAALDDHEETHVFPGIYRGIVTRIDDPELKGRVMCVVPVINGDGELDWALPCTPFVHLEDDTIPVRPTLPKVGDALWLMFEHGDIDFPVYLGTWLRRQ